MPLLEARGWEYFPKALVVSVHTYVFDGEEWAFQSSIYIIALWVGMAVETRGSEGWSRDAYACGGELILAR